MPRWTKLRCRHLAPELAADSLGEESESGDDDDASMHSAASSDASMHSVARSFQSEMSLDEGNSDGE